MRIRLMNLAGTVFLVAFAINFPAWAEQSLSGTYEMVATGICNHSTKGWYDANHVKNGPTPPGLRSRGLTSGLQMLPCKVR